MADEKKCWMLNPGCWMWVEEKCLNIQQGIIKVQVLIEMRI
jgi:hypothetical protein